MRINIVQLTEEQLLDFNYRIVERLKMLSQMKAHAQMLEFRIGQRVTFRKPDVEDQFGVIAKYNRSMQIEGLRLNAWKAALKQGDDELDSGESVPYTAATLDDITQSAKKAVDGTQKPNPDVLP